MPSHTHGPAPPAPRRLLRLPTSPSQSFSLPTPTPPIPPSLLGSPHLSPSSAFRRYHTLAELHDPCDLTHDELGLMDLVPIGGTGLREAQSAWTQPPRARAGSYTQTSEWSRLGQYSPSAMIENEEDMFFGSEWRLDEQPRETKKVPNDVGQMRKP